MRVRRVGIVVVAVLVALVLVVGVAVPAAMSTSALKGRVLAITSRAAGREVGASRVKVAPFFASVRLDGFSMAQPAGFPDGHALEADRLSFRMTPWRLLRGDLVGSLDGRGVRVNLLRRGTHTSFDGLGGAGGPPKEKAAGAREGGVHVDLGVTLSKGRLVVKNLDTNETVTLDGVGLKTHLDSATGARLPITLTVDEITRPPLTFQKVRIDAVKRGEGWVLDTLTTSLPGGGSIAGKGSFDLVHGWRLSLDASAVNLTGDLRPVAASLLPVLAAPAGDLAGRFDGGFDLEADGLTWARVKRSLRGSGNAALRDAGATTTSSVISRVAALAGLDPNAAKLRDSAASFRIEDGWIRFQKLGAHVGDVPIALDGRVSLAGDLDLTTDLAPLVKRTGSGPLQQVAGRADSLPVRITGTVTSPRIEPQRPGQLPPEIEKRAKETLQGLFGN